MGSGISVTDDIKNFKTADGCRPMERSGLSLETVETWTAEDLSSAVASVNSAMHTSLAPAIEKFGIDGAFLLSVKEADLPDLLVKKMKLGADSDEKDTGAQEKAKGGGDGGGGSRESGGVGTSDDVVVWATQSILRLQKRRTIVGRQQRLGPLPEGYQAVASRSRPGELSYLNTLTGSRTKVRPTKDALHLEPLPKGWLKVPSKRWPGEVVYMNADRPNMHLSWRPEVVTDEELMQVASSSAASGVGSTDGSISAKRLKAKTSGIQRALDRVAQKTGEMRVDRPELLLRAHTLTAKSRMKSVTLAASSFGSPKRAGP